MIGKRTNVLGTLSWPVSFITDFLKYSSKIMKKIRFGASIKYGSTFYEFYRFYKFYGFSNC